MSRKLLTATALFVSASATANPTVDTQRVTGNVSTQHSTQLADATLPPIDTCRVTGNLVAPMTKSPTEPFCRFSAGGSTKEAPIHLATIDNDRCVADGVTVYVDATPYCRIGTDEQHVDVPTQQPDPSGV